MCALHTRNEHVMSVEAPKAPQFTAIRVIELPMVLLREIEDELDDKVICLG